MTCETHAPAASTNSLTNFISSLPLCCKLGKWEKDEKSRCSACFPSPASLRRVRARRSRVYDALFLNSNLNELTRAFEVEQRNLKFNEVYRRECDCVLFFGDLYVFFLIWRFMLVLILGRVMPYKSSFMPSNADDLLCLIVLLSSMISL